jgi:hypothetical protein
MSRHDIKVEVEVEVDGLWERPYIVTGGRTRPGVELDLMSLVLATGQGTVAPRRLGCREHAVALGLCRTPVSVAEVAARLRQSVMVTKVLLSDLIEAGALITRLPPPPSEFAETTPQLLQALLTGLKKL